MTTSTRPTMPKFKPDERPAGVVVLAVLYLVGAIVFFVIFGLFLALGIWALGPLAVICVSPFLVIGIIYLLIAFGLYNLQKGAWGAALIFAIFGLLTNIWDLISVSFPAASNIGSIDTELPLAFYAIVLLPAIGIVIDFVIIIYLIIIKDYFR